MDKDYKNYLVKVVGQNEEGKNVVKLYKLIIDGNNLEYEETDIEELDWDIAKKKFSVVGVIK
jgi:hypothetical protein